jgi:solute carrier family 25 (mitochondrial carnitine/acylcarnitine transporter), member 20/29
MDEAVSGAAAGLAQVVTGYPFDTLKVHYQTKGHIRGLVARDLFRGILSPMYGGIAVNMTQFWVYGAMQRKYNNPFLSGAIAGGVISLYESPIELLKCRMQVGTESYKDCIKRIARDNPKKSPVQNLYRGFWATTLRNVPAVGIYYWSYEHTKKLFNNRYVGAFIGGSVSGILCWAPNYPIDNWKTQIQVDSSKKTLSIIEVIRRTGWQKSWRGFWPCIVRAGVVNPFVFLAYEITITHLQ